MREGDWIPLWAAGTAVALCDCVRPQRRKCSPSGDYYPVAPLALEDGSLAALFSQLPTGVEMAHTKSASQRDRSAERAGERKCGTMWFVVGDIWLHKPLHRKLKNLFFCT